MSRGYSVAQTARLVCALRWSCGRLSEILEAWAAQAADTPERTETAQAADTPERTEAAQAADTPERTEAVQAADTPEHAGAAAAMWELSRRLAAHRETLDGLQPDSELMTSWREAAPADGSLVAALDEIAALKGSVERLDIARKVLVPQLLGVYAAIGDHAAPHCDAALASAVRALRHDLDRGDAPAGAGSPGAVEAAARVLSAAGGLVERSLLRPG